MFLLNEPKRYSQMLSWGPIGSAAMFSRSVRGHAIRIRLCPIGVIDNDGTRRTHYEKNKKRRKLRKHAGKSCAARFSTDRPVHGSFCVYSFERSNRNIYLYLTDVASSARKPVADTINYACAYTVINSS